MAYKFPSPEWTQAYKDAVNASEAYRKHGKPWTFGAVAFVVKADPNQDDDELAAAIIAACKTNLADFKVPRAVYFVDDFPKATLDKVAKNELREMADAHPAV